jgi:transposase InsO family protein
MTAKSDKKTGLASFVRNRKQEPETPAPDEVPATPRKRGKGMLVAVTVRFTRDQWERVHQLALSEGTSIQDLAVRGLSRLLRDKGLRDL